MNRRIPIALAAALLISGGCTYLLARRLNFDSFSRQQQLVRYVAPVHALEAGQVLHAADLGWTDWPQMNALKGAIKDPGVAAGRVVLYPVEEGQPILERDLAAPGTGGGLGSKIPKGMRALALRSDEVVGVAGFLAPGSRLDVLVTYRTQNSSEARTVTVVQNAEVLASGQQAEPDPQGKPLIATVVTLLLTPPDAERAVAASTQGAIHFVLRNALDKEEVRSSPVSLAELGDPDTAGPASILTAGGPGRNATDGRRSGPFARARRPRWPQTSAGTGIETVFGADDEPGAGVSRSRPDAADAALAVTGTNRNLGAPTAKESQP